MHLQLSLALASVAALAGFHAHAADLVASTLPATCPPYSCPPSVPPARIIDQANTQAAVQTVEETYQRAPVATAFSPPLTFSSGTCYVSASAGGQGVTLGLSLAVPFEDRACTIRANAQALAALGERAAAVAYLAAKNPDLKRALDSVHGR